MQKKITVRDLKNFKGKQKLVCILIKNEEEALAAEKVGFEMLATGLAGKYKNDDIISSALKPIRIASSRDVKPCGVAHEKKLFGAASTNLGS